MDHDTYQPTRGELLEALGAADALPIGDELDYYTAPTDDVYDKALAVLGRNGWQAEHLTQQTLRGGTKYETFTVAGVTFVSPKGHTPLTQPPAPPIERLARLDGTVVVRIGEIEAEIDGPVAEGLREALRAVAGRPQASRQQSRDANVVPFPVAARVRLVTSDEGA